VTAFDHADFDGTSCAAIEQLKELRIDFVDLLAPQRDGLGRGGGRYPFDGLCLQPIPPARLSLLQA
jgi:hypothetical protein